MIIIKLDVCLIKYIILRDSMIHTINYDLYKFVCFVQDGMICKIMYDSYHNK